MLPELLTSELHLSRMTKVRSPLVRGLRDLTPGRAEAKEQDTTKRFAAQDPGQLCSFECHRGHFQIFRYSWEGVWQTLWAISMCPGQHKEVWLGRGGREEPIAEGVLAALLWIYKNRLDRHQEWFRSRKFCFKLWQWSWGFFNLLVSHNLYKCNGCLWVCAGSGDIFASMSLTWNSVS